jgi:hypothetical protein
MEYQSNPEIHNINTTFGSDSRIAYLTTFQKGPFYFRIKVFNHLPTSIKNTSHDINKFRQQDVERCYCFEDLAYVKDSELQLLYWNTKKSEGSLFVAFIWQKCLQCYCMIMQGHSPVCAPQRPPAFFDGHCYHIHPTVLTMYHQIITCLSLS